MWWVGRQQRASFPRLTLTLTFFTQADGRTQNTGYWECLRSGSRHLGAHRLGGETFVSCGYSEEKGSFWFRPEKERERRAPALGLSAPAAELGST